MKKLLLSFIFISVAFSGWSFPDKPGSILQKENSIQSESGYPFTYFKAHRQGFNETGLMWRISSSANVLSFQIQRSYDGEFFNPIAEIPCNTNIRFSWQDGNLFPGYIYYRIAAKFMDGTTIYSDMQVVHIVRK